MSLIRALYAAGATLFALTTVHGIAVHDTSGLTMLSMLATAGFVFCACWNGSDA